MEVVEWGNAITTGIPIYSPAIRQYFYGFVVQSTQIKLNIMVVKLGPVFWDLGVVKFFQNFQNPILT